MSKLHGNRIEVGNISTSNRNSLSNVNGHLIYNTDTNLLQYYNPAGWQSLGDASPNTKSDYPTPTGSTTVFTTIWTGSPSNLPTGDSNSTWTAPAQTTKARVIVIGGGAGHPSSYSSRGHGGVVDALIEIEGGASYKCIVGQAGNTGYAQNSREGTGAHGCGAGPGVDSNDTGSAGGGSAFFYAPPSANSDPSMFPKGVLIAGGGGGGTAPTDASSGKGPQSPDPIGGFNGISRSSGINPNMGDGGLPGGRGGRIWASYEPGDGLTGPTPARGEGGVGTPDGYGSNNYQAGAGGGAGDGMFANDGSSGYASGRDATIANRGSGGGGASGNDSGGTGGDGSDGVIILRLSSDYEATFTSGVTYTSATSGSDKIYTITATSNSSQTVTFD